MAYYEGPKGDFFMGEFQVRERRPAGEVSRVRRTVIRRTTSVSRLAPRWPWMAIRRPAGAPAVREGRAHEAVFVFDKPLTPTDGALTVQMIFGRHYACSLGTVPNFSDHRCQRATASRPRVRRYWRF